MSVLEKPCDRRVGSTWRISSSWETLPDDLNCPNIVMRLLYQKFILQEFFLVDKVFDFRYYGKMDAVSHDAPPRSKGDIRAGIALFHPLVTKTEGKRAGVYTGFEIELFEKAAELLKRPIRYREYAFKDLLPALKNGEIDVAIAGITRTEDRERSFDFSDTTFDGGLSILTAYREKLKLGALFESLFTKETGMIFGIVVAIWFIAAHTLWLIEGGGVLISKAYVPGIFEAAWIAVSSIGMLGYGGYVPATWIGKTVGIFALFIALAIFGLFLGQVSSSLTARRLSHEIKNSEDLRGRRVAVVAGTTGEKYAEKIGARLRAAPNVLDAYKLLSGSAVDAVVFDAPSLLYYASHQGAGRVRIASGTIERESYGYAFPEGSPLREDINRALLHLHEAGYYDALYREWFGKEV